MSRMPDDWQQQCEQEQENLSGLNGEAYFAPQPLPTGEENGE